MESQRTAPQSKKSVKSSANSRRRISSVSVGKLGHLVQEYVVQPGDKIERFGSPSIMLVNLLFEIGKGPSAVVVVLPEAHQPIGEVWYLQADRLVFPLARSI